MNSITKDELTKELMQLSAEMAKSVYRLKQNHLDNQLVEAMNIAANGVDSALDLLKKDETLLSRPTDPTIDDREKKTGLIIHNREIVVEFVNTGKSAYRFDRLKLIDSEKDVKTQIEDYCRNILRDKVVRYDPDQMLVIVCDKFGNHAVAKTIFMNG